MRKLLLLIRRFRNLLLFVILQVIAITLIVKNRSVQGVDILSSSNAIAGGIYEKKQNIKQYFHLKKLNDSLISENTRLRNEMALLSGIDTYQDYKVTIPITQADSVSHKDSSGNFVVTGQVKIIRYAQYIYTPAKVINNSISNHKVNYITINRGAEDGIKKDMAVVSAIGIVGRVANVSDHYATVVSALSTAGNRKISAKLHNGTTGFAYWEAGDPDHMYVEGFPLSSKIKKYDTIFTTGHSYFPENTLIGQVVKIDTAELHNTKLLKVKLSTDFRSLRYVYVVTNELDAERKALERQNIEEE